MEKYKRYLILSAQSIHELEQLVNESLDSGYELSGSLATERLTHNIQYIQPVIKKDYGQVERKNPAEKPKKSVFKNTSG